MECSLCTILFCLVVLAVIFLIVSLVVLYVMAVPYPDLGRLHSEKYFLNPKTDKQLLFPSIHDPASVDLSVIVPSYNEEDRLPAMLNEAMEYLEKRQQEHRSFSYEIIIVDDGSKDKTTETALSYSKKYGTEKVRVLTFEKNRGKGGAVRLGMFSARGKLLLFADADGASKFRDIEKLEAELKQLNNKDNLCIVCGSRAHLEKEAIATRSLFRTFLMKGFHFLVWFMCVQGVRDTQCGFKLLTRDAAMLLFSGIHIERWAFDVEMLYLAQRLNIAIGEVAIKWQEIEGTKMVPVWSWLQMGRDIIAIRLRYMLGAWKINSKPKSL